MAGSLTEAKLSTRQARNSLKPGLYWRQLDVDIHLGYRKGRQGGSWLARWYIGDGNYRRTRLGVADDIVSEGVLSFEQASKQARELVSELRAENAPKPDVLTDTVRDIVEAYIKERDDRYRAQHPDTKRRSDAASRLTKYVLKDPLAGKALRTLSEGDLIAWRKRFAPKSTFTSRDRTVTDLKAAFNGAYRRMRKRLPRDFAETIKWGLAYEGDVAPDRSPARENQILDDETIAKVVKTAAAFDADGDIGRLVLLLAATGARFSQVQRIRIADVQGDRLRIFVPTSLKGKRRERGSYPVPVSQGVIDQLAPAMAGRKPDAPLLERWRMKQAKGPLWVRDYRGAWTSAAELTRQWRAICRELGLGDEIVAYALRHSSIVRGIRNGLPIRLVAAMHDTSVAMIERHYSRFIVDGLETLAAKVVISLAA